MLEMGLLVAIGMIAMFAKMSWKFRLKMLSHPLILDLSVFVLLNAIHWGTFSGVMVAAIGALTCSICISMGRKLFGYYSRGDYVPGFINIRSKL